MVEKLLILATFVSLFFTGIAIVTWVRGRWWRKRDSFQSVFAVVWFILFTVISPLRFLADVHRGNASPVTYYLLEWAAWCVPAGGFLVWIWYAAPMSQQSRIE